MHTAEDDVFAAGVRGLLGQFVGIATKIGEANDLIALIVMSKNHAFAAQGLASGGNAVVHGVIGQDEVVFQAANWCCGCHCHVCLQLRRRMQLRLFRKGERCIRNGDVESFQRLQSIHYASFEATPRPTGGDVEATNSSH